MLRLLVLVSVISFMAWHGFEVQIGSIFTYELYPAKRFFDGSWLWAISFFIICLGLTAFIEWIFRGLNNFRS